MWWLKRKQLKTKGSSLLLFLLITAAASAQRIAPEKYFIPFTDKAETPYSITQPEAFLSNKAISRRARFGISITTQDLPVSPNYIETIKNQGNITVLYALKWFNGVVIQTTDTNALQALANLPFVKSFDYSNKRNRQRSGEKHSEKLEVRVADRVTGITDLDYGEAINQVEMININILNELGFRGEGMTIGILDSGFGGSDTLTAFQHIFNENRLLGVYDFVDNDQEVFDAHYHGMYVWSCIGANVPGEMVGTAPDASFWLFRTEDASSEYVIEEYNWAAAAEMADSAGVDVFNTSLGYTTFDDASMDHTYEDMDGNTTIGARAADIAASKGIFVVNSAGNSGSNSWYYIGTPADGDSVLAVGAVDYSRAVANFSSRGYSSDGDVKPNVMAQGVFATVWDYSQQAGYSNGTSFAGPIMAGAVASLWQANQDMSNMEVFEAIQQSAHLYSTPNADYGYGIPDFNRANILLSGQRNGSIPTWMAYPNPAGDQAALHLRYGGKTGTEATLSVTDLQGKLVYEQTHLTDSQTIQVEETVNWPTGIYIVSVKSSEGTTHLQWVKTH